MEPPSLPPSLPPSNSFVSLHMFYNLNGPYVLDSL